MTISKEVLDELLKDCKRPDDLLDEFSVNDKVMVGQRAM